MFDMAFKVHRAPMSHKSKSVACRRGSSIAKQRGMQALVGYQLTEEVVRLYCNRKDLGRFHDVAVLLSGRKRSWQAMMDSPSGDQSTVEYIASSQEDEDEVEIEPNATAASSKAEDGSWERTAFATVVTENGSGEEKQQGIDYQNYVYP